MTKVWIAWLSDGEKAALIGVYATAASAAERVNEEKALSKVAGWGFNYFVTEEGVEE